MKCKACGAEIPDGSLFCTECGAKVEQEAIQTNEAPVSEPVSAPQYTSNVAPAAPAAPAAPVYTSNAAPSAAQTAAPSKANKVVSTGIFFWLEILYALPGIGFIACIVFAAASENENIKHHALSKIILVLVALALTIIFVIICVIAISRSGLSIYDLEKIYKTLPY